MINIDFLNPIIPSTTENWIKKSIILPQIFIILPRKPLKQPYVSSVTGSETPKHKWNLFSTFSYMLDLPQFIGFAKVSPKNIRNNYYARKYQFTDCAIHECRLMDKT